jgi:hypothetical protein
MPMETTNIETIQATMYRDVQRQQRCGALRRLLEEFALQPPDTPTDYRGLLTRVQALTQEELAALDAEVAPPADATPEQAEEGAASQAEEETKGTTVGK